MKDISGQPVVSFIDCYPDKLSKFVVHYIQLHTKDKAGSYVKDTTDFINKLENLYQNLPCKYKEIKD